MRLVRALAGSLTVLLVAASTALAQEPTPPATGSQSSPPPQPPPPPPVFTTAVTVVGTTPLPGVEVPISLIAAPVQAASDHDIEQSGALDLSDFLNQRLTSVHVNAIQGNPFQSDINYRGYTASPLLGTPQGLSVYMDGVRLNQPFATSSAGT